MRRRMLWELATLTALVAVDVALRRHRRHLEDLEFQLLVANDRLARRSA